MYLDRAQGVIGGMFGDEGKGLMADALAARMLARHGQCIVARFNGGAQAGHTVHTERGRHIFHHVGSGALAGATTYLARRFVAHPMLFLQELAQVEALGGNGQVFADPRCLATTPYDVMVNQAIEQARGAGRHGSCGVGFGETIERNLHAPYAFTLADMRSERHLRRTLDGIRREYLPGRLQALGLDPHALDRWRMEEGILERYMQDVRAFLDRVWLQSPGETLAGPVVFEGAQGLALDEDLGAFPHVTRSKTGLPYLLEACQEAGIGAIDVHYGTRAYTTRHGAGPFDYEDGVQPPGFSDPTNQPNAYQGSLRFSPLQAQALGRFVQADLARNTTGVRVRHGVWVSCLDQMGPSCPLAGSESVATAELPDYLGMQVAAEWAWGSWGPRRNDVRMQVKDAVPA